MPCPHIPRSTLLCFFLSYNFQNALAEREWSDGRLRSHLCSRTWTSDILVLPRGARVSGEAARASEAAHAHSRYSQPTEGVLREKRRSRNFSTTRARRSRRQGTKQTKASEAAPHRQAKPPPRRFVFNFKAIYNAGKQLLPSHMLYATHSLKPARRASSMPSRTAPCL